MNSILFYTTDFVAPDRIRVSGARAIALKARHELVSGITVSGMEYGKDRLTVRVDLLSDEQIECTVLTRGPGPLRPPLIACVGVPRPQTVKKVLQAAALFGVSELHFVRSLATEKNYLDSRSLRPEEITAELELGLEQAWDPVAPVVRVWREHRAWEFQLLPELAARFPERDFLIAHTPRGAREQIRTAPLPMTRAAIVLVGPERGWTEDEVARCISFGAFPLSLGDRFLRVDTALVASFAQIALRRHLSLSL